MPVVEIESIPNKEVQIRVVTADWQEEDIIERIQKAFPEEPETMVAIAKCESGLNQSAISHTNDFGLFQINHAVWDSTAQAMGLDYKNSLPDNIKMARHVYDTQGITAWVCLDLI